MYTLWVKTKPFIDKFAIEEIKRFYKKEVYTLSPGFYSILIEKEKELFELVMNMTYYSRTIERLYLKVCNFGGYNLIRPEDIDISFITKNATFEVRASKDYASAKQEVEKFVGDLILQKTDKLTVDLDNPDLSFKIFKIEHIEYLGIDLTGFKLTKRDYKLNMNSHSINSLVPIYCFYLLDLDKKEGFSIIDPVANVGDIIIEASLFDKNKAFNVKKRHNLPIVKFLDKTPFLPKDEPNNNKYIAVVQNNKIFKLLRENINFSGSKIKVSQYELDWLDVKFKKDDIDYVICQFPTYKEEADFDAFQSIFFYQAEFVAKHKICVISKRQVNEKHIKKNKLKIVYYEEIFIGEQRYFIYIIK